MPTDDLIPRLDFARAIAREAGALTLKYYQTPELAVEFKSDASPVTLADRQAEQLLRERIAASYPGDGIVGEEFPETRGHTGYRWILDPIDGTQSFIAGVPLYGTMIGVERDGACVLGAVYFPALDELISAARGHGAWHQRGVKEATRARVSNKSRLSEALLCASDTRFPTPERCEVYRRLQQAVRTSRTWGDCYGYLLVATGRADVMIDPLMNIWDAAAIQPIILEAGGTFTDWQGRETHTAGESIGTNGKLLQQILGFTRGA